MLKFNFDYLNEWLSEDEILDFQEKIFEMHNSLINKTCKGNEFTGWVEYPINIKNDLLDDIETTAQEIRKNNAVFVSIGIGGSYLGAKAVIEALTPTFKTNNDTEIIFAGNSISVDYHFELLNYLKQTDKDVFVNVISKSGTTTEPAIAFRFLKNFLIEKYNEKEFVKQIIATTDEKKGALKNLADDEGYQTYVIPDDVGGRFSVFTPVGLLPIAVAGINIRELLKGAQDCNRDLNNFENNVNNPAYKYAIVRNLLFQKGKSIEILANYNPKLHFIAEWWKQLFGESEGKNGKGIYTASVDFTTDLHSLGQMIQDGVRNIFETVINITEADYNLIIPEFDADIDGLNYIAGKDMNFVNQKALEGTLLAHLSGGVPNILIEMDKLNAYNIGYLIYFFERACAYSGLLLGVNPFDQPGVETYKKKMFELLGKK
jgi:glucose-6-phosphate isomerase